ncbi:glutamate--tRNA ligase [Buchnera aphidicola]|uniref:glutamate--tRNA ligase n=1 Tax=Buchnera aphidicola TaxID=9 RepID=UPI0031B7F6C1
MKIRTRFAPSPTGLLHIGGARTALYSWLFAKRHKGSFILRIEDTDVKRSSSKAIKSITEGLIWLGIKWDEGPFFQVDKLSYYQRIIKSMILNKMAYKCYCSKERLEVLRKSKMLKKEKPKYDRRCRKIKQLYEDNRSYVVRFCNPLEGSVIVDDQIKGKIIFQNKELDDLIIQRVDGMPTYNFCVVIDDRDMKISHIIRGEDHINNTPRQINILKSLGADIPVYAHLPLIVDKKGKKISKRDNLIDIIEYSKKGFLPDSLVNYMLRLGWSNGDKEIFSIEEVKKIFNLKDISTSSSTFDIEKLSWYNRFYIRNASVDYLEDILKKQFSIMKVNLDNNPRLKDLIQFLRFRFDTIKDMALACSFFYEEHIVIKNIYKKYFFVNTKEILLYFFKKINSVKKWNVKEISLISKKILEKFKINFKDLAIPLRIILIGKDSSFPINVIVFLLGRKKVSLRIKKGLELIN